jgi:probable phosphoglycerate mutase
MLRLLLVRHGRRLEAAGRYQGQIDVPLSDVGRQQARALGARTWRRRRSMSSTQRFTACRRDGAAHRRSHSLPGPQRSAPAEISFGEWRDSRSGDPGALS